VDLSYTPACHMTVEIPLWIPWSQGHCSVSLSLLAPNKGPRRVKEEVRLQPCRARLQVVPLTSHSSVVRWPVLLHDAMRDAHPSDQTSSQNIEQRFGFSTYCCSAEHILSSRTALQGPLNFGPPCFRTPRRLLPPQTLQHMVPISQRAHKQSQTRPQFSNRAGANTCEIVEYGHRAYCPKLRVGRTSPKRDSEGVTAACR
jgi:hypothetical protein